MIRTNMHCSRAFHRIVAAGCLVSMMVMGIGVEPLPIHAATARGTHIRYFNIPTPYSLEIPALYQDTVVWTGQAKDNLERLYTAQLSHFQPRVIAVAHVGYFMIQTHVSASWIIWEEQAPRGSWTIWALNRVSGRKSLIDSADKTGNAPHPLLFPALSLAGNTMAWSHAECRAACMQQASAWEASIHLRTLPSGTDQTIMATNAPCSQTWPSISGRYLAWHEEGACEGHPGSDVLLYDRRTGKIRHVTSDHESSEPTTNGVFLAWKQSASQLENGAILLLNLRTGQESVATNHLRTMGGCLSTNNRWIACAAEPAMGGSVLAWEAGNGGVLVARDLRSGRQYVLERGSKTGRPGYGIEHVGQGWGNRVVWQAWTASRKDQTYARRLIGTAIIP